MRRLVMLAALMGVSCVPVSQPTCASACERWAVDECKAAEPVCVVFDEGSGECLDSIECVEDCEAHPRKYDLTASCP